jgi:hypothetical protein
MRVAIEQLHIWAKPIQATEIGMTRAELARHWRVPLWRASKILAILQQHKLAASTGLGPSNYWCAPERLQALQKLLAQTRAQSLADAKRRYYQSKVSGNRDVSSARQRIIRARDAAPIETTAPRSVFEWHK